MYAARNAVAWAFASSFVERSVLGDQPVLDGEHAGADAVGRSGLRVDVLDVVARRLLA
jgi:hypothetical protein